MLDCGRMLWWSSSGTEKVSFTRRERQGHHQLSVCERERARLLA